MAEPFVISAMLQIVAPSAASVSLLRANIKKQLGNLNAVVNLKVGSTKSLDDLDRKITGVTKSVGRLSKESEVTAANLREMGGAFGNIKANLASLGPSLNKVNGSFVNTTKVIRSAKQETVSFAEQAGLASRRFLAFTLPTTALFAFTKAISTGIKEIFTFERELIKIAQATDRPTNSLKSLEDTVTGLSVQLGVSSSEMINAAKVLAQAGFTAKDTEKALSALAKSDLAPSFDSIARSTEGMISVFSQFESDASKLEAIFGSINAVAAKYPVESDDIITAIQKTGGAFKVAGGNIHELIGLFTAVRSTTRESADTIAVAFRTIFTRLQRPETIGFLRQFNIELQEAGKFVGPVEAVKRINEVVSKLGKGDLRISAIAEEIGGLRQVSKTIPLIQQAALGQEAINTSLKGTASLNEDVEQSLDGFLRKLSQVREEFLALFREMGKTKSFQIITTSLIQLLHGANQLLRTFKELVPLLVIGGTFLAGRSIIRGGAAGFVSKFLKRDTPSTTIPFASGGVVPGPNVNKDIVPAMLMPGEFVLNKASVAKIGLANLTRVNNSAGPPRQKGGITFFGPQEDLEPLVKAIADQLGKSVSKVSINTKTSKIGGSSLLGSVVVPGALTKGIDIQKLTQGVTGGAINTRTGGGISNLGKDSLALLTGLVSGVNEFGKAIEDTSGAVEQGSAALKQEIALAKQRKIALREEALITKQEADIAKQTSSLRKQKVSALKDQVAVVKVEKQVTSEVRQLVKAQSTITPQGTTIADSQLFRRQPSINLLLGNIIDATEKQNRNQARLQRFKLEDILGPSSQSGSPLNVILKETEIQNKEYRAFLQRNEARQRALSIIPGRGVGGPGVLVPSRNRIFTENLLPLPQGLSGSIGFAATGADLGPKISLNPSPLVTPRTPFVASQNAQSRRQANILRRQLRNPTQADTIIANAIARQNQASGVSTAGLVSLGTTAAQSTSPTPGSTFGNGVVTLPRNVLLNRSERIRAIQLAGRGSLLNTVSTNLNPSSIGSLSRSAGTSVKGLFSKGNFGLAATVGAGIAGSSIQASGLKTGSEIKTGLGGALSGAAVGAAIGSIVPGIGTAVGGIVGGLTGVLFALDDFDETVKNAKIAKNLDNIGQSFSDLNQAIETQDTKKIDIVAGATLNNIRQSAILNSQPLDRIKRQEADLIRQTATAQLQNKQDGRLAERVGPVVLRALFGRSATGESVDTRDTSKFSDASVAELLAPILGLSTEALLARDEVQKYTNAIRKQTSILDILSDRFADLGSNLDRATENNSFVTGLGEGIGGFAQSNRKLSLGSSLFDQNLGAISGNPQLQQASAFASEVNAAFVQLRSKFAGGLLDELIASATTGGADIALENTIGGLSTSDNVKRLLNSAVRGFDGEAVGEKDATTILKDLFGAEAISLPIDKLNSVIQEQTSALDKHANIMKGIAEFSQKILSQTQTVNNSIQTAQLTVAELQSNRTGQRLSSIVGDIGFNTFKQNQGILGGGLDPTAIGVDARNRISGLQAFVAGGGGNTARGISSIVAEQTSITNLIQSLKNLTDPANLAADAIRELSEVEEERAARLGLLNNFLGQDSGGRRSFLRTAQNAQRFAAGGAGFFDSLNTQRQKELLDFVSSNAGVSIGGRKLGAIANEQLPFTAGGRQLEALGFGLGGLNAERADLEAEIGAANATAVEAQRQLLEILQTQGSLLKDTTDGFQTAVEGFNGAVATFSNAVDRIPSSIELRGINEIQVNIAGTNGLNQLSSSIQRQVLNSVANKLKQVIPEASAKIERSFGSV
jgi:TP901 family phage tail tape measure protein